MLKESKANEEFEYQRLSPEEQKSRGILGRLIGVCADFINPTRNGRKYSEKLWENVFNDPIMKEKIANRCCFGELGHPADRTETDMEKIAICLAEQPTKGTDGKLRAIFDILNTPNGRILKALCDYGCNIGISSRGEGDLITNYDGSESVDPETYDCQCWDAVLIPAVKEARLAYVTESLDKKRYNKTLRKSLQESLEKASEEERKIMEETLTNLNINLNEEQNLDEIEDEKQLDEAIYNVIIIISIIDAATGDRIARYDVNNRAKAFNFINEHPEKQYVLVYERWINNKFESSQILARRATHDDILKYRKANNKTNIYINGRYIPKDTAVDVLDDAIEDDRNVVLIGFGSKITEQLDFNALMESFNTRKSLNEEEAVVTNFDFDNIVDDLTNYYSHGWPLELAEKSLQLSKQFNIISQEQFDEILANIRDNIGQNSEAELETTNSDKDLDIDGVVHEDAVDTNEALVNELQESLKQKQDLEQKLIDLQEKLSVCYTKEAKSEEEAVKYKETVRKLAEDSKKATALQSKVALLEEKLNDATKKEEALKTQLSEAREKAKFAAEKNISLKENVSKKGEEAVKLNESVASLKNTVKELEESKVKEISSLKEAYNKKLKNVINEGKVKEADLQKEISSLNENLKTQKTEFTQKIEKSTKLIEKYKKAASIAVDKYIESQAVRLGSSVNEVKNRLPESYTFKDIDKVCEDLQEYNLNMSKLPFNAISRRSVNESVKIKGLSSKNESILPAHSGFDDDIDEDLMYLAGK